MQYISGSLCVGVALAQIGHDLTSCSISFNTLGHHTDEDTLLDISGCLGAHYGLSAVLWLADPWGQQYDCHIEASPHGGWRVSFPLTCQYGDRAPVSWRLSGHPCLQKVMSWRQV